MEISDFKNDLSHRKTTTSIFKGKAYLYTFDIGIKR
jgi:hypothetical protein